MGDPFGTREKSVCTLRSTKTSRQNEEHVDFADVILVALNKYDCPIDVTVSKDLLAEPLKALKGPKKTKVVPQLTPMVSRAASGSQDVSTTVLDAEQEYAPGTLTMVAAHDVQDNLMEIEINKYRFRTIPRILIKVLGIILPNYAKLNKLTIRNSSIDKYTIYEIKNILCATKITDICLDYSFLTEANYDILLQKATSLRHLSLKGCRINDDICKQIVSQLLYNQPAEMMQTLNLASNQISELGAKSIAEVLRTNRYLRFLNLADNRIMDDGAGYILDNFKEFPLYLDEILNKRELYMKYLRNKQAVYMKVLQDLDIRSVGSRKSPGRRRRSLTSLKSTVDKKDHHSSISRKDALQLLGGVDDDAFNAKAEKMAADLMGPFRHPYSQVTIKDGYSYSKGNFVLCYLNLAYNNLMFPSLLKLLQVLEYQQNNKNDGGCGLKKVIIEGNYLPQECAELDKIDNFLNTMSACSSSAKKKRKSIAGK